VGVGVGFFWGVGGVCGGGVGCVVLGLGGGGVVFLVGWGGVLGGGGVGCWVCFCFFLLGFVFLEGFWVGGNSVGCCWLFGFCVIWGGVGICLLGSGVGVGFMVFVSLVKGGVLGGVGR